MANFVCFSLRTKTEEEKKKTKEILKQLRLLFGEESIDVDYFDAWFSVEITNAKGWIGINDIGFNNKSRFHIYRDMGEKPNINYDVPLEQCDTIYNM